MEFKAIVSLEKGIVSSQTKHNSKICDEQSSENASCHICSKTFKSTWHMENHISRIHKKSSGVELCKICGKSVTRLKRHIAQVHFGRKEKCYVCNKDFLRLQHHQNLIHRKGEKTNIQEFSIVFHNVIV